MMYQGQTEKPPPTCGYCGRALGGGFNFTCHMCGATYCYAHKPERCDHQKAKAPSVNAPPPEKT
jgi:hypothetical protein